MKIVIFGGSFDPPHLGHLAIYKVVNKHLKFNKFIVVPAACSPFKRDNQPIASNDARILLTKIMFRKCPNVVVDDYEIKSTKKTSYSIDTIKHLSKKYKDTCPYLVMGYDQYLLFPQWKSWQEILKRVKLIVINRHKIINTINPLNDWKCFNVSLKQADVSHIQLIKMRPINCSSAQLRDNFDKRYIDNKVLFLMQSLPIYLKYFLKKNNVSKARQTHIINVVDLATKLLKQNYAWTIKFRLLLAAFYHDLCKEWTDEQLKQFVGEYDGHKYPSIHCLHGLAASKWLVMHNYVKDKIVLNAITNHVIPPEKAEIITSLLYIADKLEKDRLKTDVPYSRTKLVNEALVDYRLVFQKLLQFNKNKYKKH